MHVCPRFSLLLPHAHNSGYHQQGHSMHLRRVRQSSRLRAQQKTAEPQSLQAPGSASNFEDVPKNRDKIITTSVSDRQMQVLRLFHGGCQKVCGLESSATCMVTTKCRSTLTWQRQIFHWSSRTSWIWTTLRETCSSQTPSADLPSSEVCCLDCISRLAGQTCRPLVTFSSSSWNNLVTVLALHHSHALTEDQCPPGVKQCEGPRCSCAGVACT